ncbi:MAG: hypothetical protein V7L29_22505 [Nostoc sp.]
MKNCQQMQAKTTNTQTGYKPKRFIKINFLKPILKFTFITLLVIVFVVTANSLALTQNAISILGVTSNLEDINSITGIDQGYENLPRFLADVNGDTRADYCRFVGNSPDIYLSCNLATAFGFSTNQYGFNSITGIDQGYENLPRFLADVNGDTRADYCRFVGDTPNIYLSCNLAAASGFSTNQYEFNSITGIDQGYENLPRFLADVNGDTRADYCRFVGDPNIYLSCNLATASGFSTNQYEFNSITGIDRGYENLPRFLADVNGDTRADYCRFVGDPNIYLSCNLATASGFSTNQYEFNSITGIDRGYENLPRFLADVNRDKRADYCRFVGNTPNIFLSCDLATVSGFR